VNEVFVAFRRKVCGENMRKKHEKGQMEKNWGGGGCLGAQAEGYVVGANQRTAGKGGIISAYGRPNAR